LNRIRSADTDAGDGDGVPKCDIKENNLMTYQIRKFLESFFLPLFTIGILLLVLIVYLPSQAASDDTFIVNSPYNTDDGTCEVANCTLREAINAANIAAGANTIVFSLPTGQTVFLSGSSLPLITSTLTIDGSTSGGVSINGGGGYTGIFVIDSGTAVTITSLYIPIRRVMEAESIIVAH